MSEKLNEKKIQFIPCDDLGGGGKRVGSLFASFYDLEAMFGKPAFEGKGDKITTEFCIDFEVSDGTGEYYETGTFRLYDWHYARDFNNDHEEIEWNIGGNGYDDSSAADDALAIFKNTDVRYEDDEACMAKAKWHDLPEKSWFK